MEEIPSDRKLEVSEFFEICADNGLLEGSTAILLANFAKALGGVGALPRQSGAAIDNSDSFADILQAICPGSMTFENLVTTDENFYTCEIAHTFALIPRIWKGVSPLMVHAPTGRGKTHLLAAMTRATRTKALMMNTVDFQIEYQHAVSQGVERDLREWIISHDLLLLDDIQYCRGDMAFQKFIVSIMNRMPREMHGLVTSSDIRLQELSDIYSSFYSRLTAGLVVNLNVVDLKGRRRILELFFSDTGIMPSDEVMDFLAETFTSNVRQLKAAARMVLAKMLGSGEKPKVENVRQILEFLIIDELSSRKKPAPDEESDEPEGPPEPSPYIIVDVDERESADMEAKKELYMVEDDSELFRDLIASTDTVEMQSRALSIAIELRITQLMERNDSQAEVKRLNVALDFLSDGNLEAAFHILKI